MRRLPSLLALLALAAACSSGSAHRSASARTSQSPQPPAASASPTGPPTPAVHDATVWLCDPRSVPNPCTTDETSTAVLADGTPHREPPPTVRQRDLDCFYVYPTVSRQPAANADLHVDQQEVDVAIAQASRFSSVCRVWAPMYRQRTVNDLFNLPHGVVSSPQNLLAYASLRAAWRDYLAHDNRGRRVVFIGHSQGAAMLVRLLRSDVDPVAAVRRKVALAILAGANVTVASGRTTGGSFHTLPLCTRRSEPGCVIAYSTFPGVPPAFSLFARPGAGVSGLSGDLTSAGRQVACVNPAAFGGAGLLEPYFPSKDLPSAGTATPWTSYPGRYRAECRHLGSATWLQVTPTGGKADKRALAHADLGPAWGFHILDVTLALGNLVHDVAALPAG